MKIAKKSRFNQGYYPLKHPEKYVGANAASIRFMSSWELSTHSFFDNNTRVLHWSSESICIPYIKPTDGKIHKYFPDYWVEYVTPDGEIIQEVIEVKPAAQTKMPKSTNKHKVYEQLTYAINIAKWQACSMWCKQRNMTFRIITEHSIFK